jgi:hypothetical protein
LEDLELGDHVVLATEATVLERFWKG